MPFAEPIPVLMYHSLDGTGSVISTPPLAFRSQMQHLRDRGFQGIALGELLDAWDAGSLPWPQPVVLTFDDAFRSVAEHGVPALAEVGFRATVFAVAGYCGRTNAWPGQSRGIPILPLLSVPELRCLRAAGIEIGSHSRTHAALDRVQGPELVREIVESRHVLEDALGVPVPLFAYPYGAAGPAARELVGQHYRSACSVLLARARREGDRHFLPRIDMYYFRHPKTFQFFGRPLGNAYIAARGMGRRVKRALLA